jgi:hypothetical protein
MDLQNVSFWGSCSAGATDDRGNWGRFGVICIGLMLFRVSFERFCIGFGAFRPQLFFSFAGNH